MQMDRERNVMMRSSLLSEDVSCHSSPSRAHLAVRINPISISSALALYEIGKLCSSFHLSLHRILTVSPLFLLYLPYIALFSQCERRFSLHAHFFLSPIFPLISLFFPVWRHWGGELAKKELRLLIEKPKWLYYFMKHRRGHFEEISQTVVSKWGLTSPKMIKKTECFVTVFASVLSNTNLQYKKGYINLWAQHGNAGKSEWHDFFSL